jgi:hypothetical protein
MFPLDIADRFRQLIRQMGWVNGVLYVFDRLLATVSGRRVCLHKNYLVAQPVPRKRRLPPHRGTAIEVRQITAFDPIIREFPRPAWAAPYRFNQGATCLAALQAGKFIGFMWLTLGPYQEDEFRCRFVPVPEGRSAWDFDVYVDPAHRNGIAFLRLWDEANGFLTEHQVPWSLSRISAFNSGSMLSHARMGAQRVGAVAILSIGSWQVSAATVPPYFHFSTHPESFPTFVLNPERLCRPVRAP